MTLDELIDLLVDFRAANKHAASAPVVIYTSPQIDIADVTDPESDDDVRSIFDFTELDLKYERGQVEIEAS